MVKAKNKKDKRIIPLRQPGKSVETNDDRPSKLLFDEVLRQTEARPDPDQTQTTAEPRPDPDQKQNDKNTKAAPKVAKQPAPVRDYNKRANSIDRDALPLGYFPGASKKIYDAIYLRTRGAVVPTRTTQATRRELMDWSGIQNIKTINAHLKRLRESGLLKVTNFIGEQSGSIYEVFLPEEVGLELDPDQTQTRPNPDQKMDSDQYQKMVWVGLGKDIENKDTYSNAKTSLKTIKNDDDSVLAIFAKKLGEASRKLTGKETSPNEAEKWGKLAELLILELEFAARNTKSISSVPAFLTEVLRRRLILNPEEKNQTRSNKLDQKKSNRMNVGKNYDDVESSYNPETGEYEIKPLSEAGKAKALELVYEAKTEGGNEFLEDLKKWYLPEDWEWLIKELENKLSGE